MADPKWVSDFDDREADEAVKQATGKGDELPEAPISITVKGYYKGFSALFTKRLDGDRLVPQVDGVVQLIDYLINKGFQPSWNVETNEKTAGNVDYGKCDKCGAEMKKSQKTGKLYCSNLCWKK